LPESEWSLLIAGIIFGLSGGLTPGPLFTFIISETLKYGTGEGIKIALVPVLSDLPIVLISLYLVSELTKIDLLVGIIAVCGGIYLLYLAIDGILFKGTTIDNSKVRPQSIKKGIGINLLNPNPYVFWFTIGAPTVIQSSQQSLTGPAVFIIGMYFCLVGSKILLAILVGRSRTILKSNFYIYTIRLLGLVLLIFAFLFFYRAWSTFQL
jgi:threonine/homoserine/homoserine lactone efflux protein